MTPEELEKAKAELRAIGRVLANKPSADVRLIIGPPRAANPQDIADAIVRRLRKRQEEEGS